MTENNENNIEKLVEKNSEKTAVILFNLGGPDEIRSIKPFLFNLFYDPAIISLNNPMRWLLAKFISSNRTPKAKKIYNKIGGKSPILEQTNAQAQALEEELSYKNEQEGREYRVFTCMRYWHPMSDTVAKNVKKYNPDNIILLPLYPQFSTTTTASSFDDWERAASKVELDAPTSKICCYPTDLGFIASHARLIKDAYWRASETGKPRVLFSAHGLPEKVIEKGDPYQFQVEKTVEMITQVLAIEELDYSICYQSKVGRLKWLSPSTEDEIKKAGTEEIPLLIVPVSFVSEHSETLVELDIEYRELADKWGVTGYVRVPTLGVDSMFIETLADLCLNIKEKGVTQSFEAKRLCKENLGACPCSLSEKSDDVNLDKEAA
ncbi:MAG: ferrochelatase [Rickettsiales bacterium]